MKKHILFILTALLLCPLSSHAKKPVRITVLCYNIQIGKRAEIDEYVKFAQKYSPDVIALQEVDYMTRRSTMHEDLAGELAEKMEMNSVFQGNLHFSDGQYGIALLTRFPIISAKALTLPQTETSNERRGALSVVVSAGKKQNVNITCTHLDLDRDTRPEQVSAIDKWVTHQGIPAILCGDFNAMPEDTAIAVISENWKQMCTDEPTWPNASPQRKIDYFFTSGKGTWRTVSYERIAECPLSDHCPLIITLEYTE